MHLDFVGLCFVFLNVVSNWWLGKPKSDGECWLDTSPDHPWCSWSWNYWACRQVLWPTHCWHSSTKGFQELLLLPEWIWTGAFLPHTHIHTYTHTHTLSTTERTHCVCPSSYFVIMLLRSILDHFLLDPRPSLHWARYDCIVPIPSSCGEENAGSASTSEERPCSKGRQRPLDPI